MLDFSLNRGKIFFHTHTHTQKNRTIYSHFFLFSFMDLIILFRKKCLEFLLMFSEIKKIILKPCVERKIFFFQFMYVKKIFLAVNYFMGFFFLF